jgi:hypothetical protein
MNKLEQLCSKVLKEAIFIEVTTWPPTCNSILYQPERPCSEQMLVDEAEKQEENNQ